MTADLGPEPFSYAIMITLGVLAAIAGVVALVISALMFFKTLMGSSDSPSDGLPVAALVAGFPFGIGVSLILFGALMEIVVDIARNVREMRFHAECTALLLRRSKS